MSRLRTGIDRWGMHSTFALAVVGLLATGCEGDEGERGPQGPEGPAGAPGPDGVDPGLSTLDKAVVGLGGEVALTALGSYVIEASGTRLAVGEGFSPGDPSVEISRFSTTVTRDLVNDGLRVDWERPILFFPGDLELVYSEIIAGDVGVVVGSDSVLGFNTGDMPSSRWAAVRKQERLLDPHSTLLAALNMEVGAELLGTRFHNGTVHEVLRVEDATAPLDVFVDARTGLISKIATTENDHLLRDVPLEVHYANWEPSAIDLLFPQDVFIVLDGELVHSETRLAVMVNPTLEAGIFDFPDGAQPTFDAEVAEFGEASHQFHQIFAGLGLPFDVPQLFVQPTELAPGVFLVAGGSHNSMAVEQADGVVIVEAPLYPERADAIIAWAADQFPGKPISHVIATHHHHDHSAGLRSFVAAGATVVLSDRSASFFRRVFAAASTVVPDALAAKPVIPTVVGVDDDEPLVLADPTNPVTVRHIDTFHAEDMVVVSVDSSDHVFNSDMWNPGNGGSATFADAARELFDFVDAEIGGAPTMVGGHGAVGPYAELEAFVSSN